MSNEKMFIKQSEIVGYLWLMPAILVTQEDHGSKPAWANSSQDPILKIPNTHTHTHTHTEELVEWLKVKVLSPSPKEKKKSQVW
jgi:hypothetical protein